MSIQHQNFVTLALKLIERHGRPVVLSLGTNTGPDYDPVTTYQRYGVKAVNDKIDIKEVNDLIRSTDKKFLIGNTCPITSDMSLRDYDPSVHDRIPMGRINGESDPFESHLIADYSIRHLMPIIPGSTTVYYEVYASV